MPKRPRINEDVNSKFTDLVTAKLKVKKVLPEITEDDEVYIVQLPRSIEPKTLEQARLKFKSKSKKSKIKTAEQVFLCKFQQERKIIHVADSGVVKQIEVKGSIRVKTMK